MLAGEEGASVAINYVGRPEGAEETKESIEHGVDICMKQMSEAGTKPIRFWLREAGLIKSSPQKVIAQGTDWRFLNELKRELKV